VGGEQARYAGVTDAFDYLEWKTTSKGQRTALGPEDWPPGTYTLTRDWGIPDVLYRRGQRVWLEQKEATRLGLVGAIVRGDG
jgi:hypothetical protein